MAAARCQGLHLRRRRTALLAVMLGVTVGKELYERFVCLLTVMAEQLTALIPVPAGAGRIRRFS